MDQMQNELEPGVVVETNDGYRHSYPTAETWSVEASEGLSVFDDQENVLAEYAPGAWRSIRREARS